MTAPPMATSVTSDARLGGPPWALLAVAFFGTAHMFVTLPVLPLLLAKIGADSLALGAVTGAFAFASILSRPFIGSAGDRWGLGPIVSIGLVLGALVGGLQVLGVFVLLLLGRALQGVAWSAFNTGAIASLALSVQPARLAPAAARYTAMPALAQMTAPAIGLWLATSFSLAAPFALAAGLAGLGILAMRRVPGARQSNPSASGRGSFIERAALLPMLLDMLYTCGQSLLWVFAPVVAAARGIQLGQLAIYFVCCGAALLLGRLIVARVEVPPRRLIHVGLATGAVGLALAGVAPDLRLLIAGGVLYGLGASLASPALLATAMGRAPRHRKAAAAATYSTAFQLAAVLSAPVWGFQLATMGSLAPFVTASLLCLVALIASLALRQRLTLGDAPREGAAPAPGGA